MRSFRYTFISASVALSVISTGIFANPHIKVRTSVDKNESFSSVERVIDPDYNASISEWIVIMKQKPLLLTEDSGALRKVSGSLSGLSLNQRSKFKQQLQAYEDEIYAQQNSVLETAFKKNSGEKLKQRFSRTVNAMTVLATDEEVSSLRANKLVKGVYKNTKVKKLLSESVELIGAPEAWSKVDKNGVPLTGDGIKVAVVDTGVDYSHPDLGGCFGLGCKVFGGYDFVDKDNDPMDVDGHGTHVAGIVAARGTLRGVAPDADILAVRVLGNDGYGDTSDIIAGIEYAVDPDGDPLTDDGVDVINLSLGGMGGHDSPGSLAVDAAVEAGVVVIAAAGNDGNYNDIANHSPASARLAITVGSTEKYGSLSTFSSKGPLAVDHHIKPEVVAPGGEINSLGMGHDYIIQSGTSMASPHVAGSAALLLQNNPNLKPDEVKALLMSSSTSIDIDPYAQGYGLINVSDALDYTIASSTPPIDFGNLTKELDGTVINVSLDLTNISALADKVYLSLDAQLPTGVELYLRDNELSVDPQGSASTKVSLLIKDADSIPFLESAPGAYYGNILVSPENSPSFNVPVSFKRNHLLTISHDSPGGIDLSIDTNEGVSLYWGPVGPNESREIELAPGKLYFTVDYLGLDVSDLSHIEGFAENFSSKGLIYGYEGFELDVTESKKIKFSVKDLTTPIGIGKALNSTSTISNTHTAFTRLKQQFKSEAGVEFSYEVKNISNTNLKEGQKNEYLIVGNVPTGFDVNYEALERFDNESGIDTLFHINKVINEETGPNFYTLDNPSHELLLKAPKGSEEIFDFSATAFNSPWNDTVPTSGVKANKVLFSRIAGSDESSIQFTLLEADSSILEVSRIQTSPNLSFESDYFVIDGTKLSEYAFEPLNPTFSGALELSEGNAFLMGDVPSLMSINGSQGAYTIKKYSLYCNGVLSKEGSLESVNIESAITGCDQNSLFDLTVTNTVDNESKITRIEHEFDSSYSIINGIEMSIVDANFATISSTDISTKRAFIAFSLIDSEHSIGNVQWKLSSAEEWNSVNVDNVQEGSYSQIASLPTFFTEQNSIDVKVTHTGTNSVTTHTLYEMLTVGVDLSSIDDDIDNDGIVNAYDLDNDNDGIPDTWETMHGLNPVDSEDASIDTDNDGLSNYQEYRKGLNPNSRDSDNDGILDGVDETASGVELISAGNLVKLVDLNNDGNAEFANISLNAGFVNLHILDGARQIVDAQYNYGYSFSNDGFTTELLNVDSENNLNLVIYGIRTDKQGSGRPRALSIDITSGEVRTVYNWPAILDNPILVVLDDLNGDSVPEVGLSGIHKELQRPQMIVRDGATGDAVSKFSHPSIFNDTSYYRFSDANNDGVKDVAMMGTLDRNGKIQVKVSDALDSSIIHGYTFANKWEQTSLHQLSDLNYDGFADWGLLGRNKIDKRWQLIQKSALDPRGVLQIHAWPEDLDNAKFLVLPDMTGDDISEVAMYGVRSSSNRIQLIIKDGANRNSTVGSYGWANVFTDYRFHIEEDFTGDNVSDIVFAGKLDNQKWQTFVVNSATNARIFREASSADMTDILQITTSSDINYDGKNDLVIWGKKSNGELMSESYAFK